MGWLYFFHCLMKIISFVLRTQINLRFNLKDGNLKICLDLYLFFVR